MSKIDDREETAPVAGEIVPSATRLPYLSGLRTFFAVARYGSFSAAAEVLGVAPSAVNRQVASLEDRLGERLFDRSRGRGGLQLTDVGAVLQARVTAMMNELLIAEEEIGMLRGLQKGHIRLGINEVVATQVLPGILRRIHADYPQITCQITVQNSPVILQKLLAGEIDVGLGYNIPVQPDIVFHEVINHDTYVITAIDDPLAGRSTVTLRDLVGRQFIFPEGSMALRRRLDSALAENGIQLRPFIETDSFTLLRALVAHGLGISIVTGRLESSSEGGLSYVKIEDPAFRFGTLGCCTRKGRTISSASQIFIETARSAMEPAG